MSVDYSLYLVTDSTKAILGERDLVSIVEDAIAGGVTIVQYRDKTSDTKDLIATARKLHEVCKAADVPLLINDRIDVALAIGAEGVHIGQDDMDLETARRLLGEDAIIGVTAASVEEATAATEGGANYLGIGTVYATPTKENTKSIIGTTGVQEILSALSALEIPISTVCIGGINTSNLQRILYQSKSADKSLDGVAVVSAIIAAEDPKAASATLKELITTPPAFAQHPLPEPAPDVATLLISEAPDIIQKLAAQGPLCHNMTNLVVQNFAANVALAIGASPIMSNNGLEASDLASLGGALVINMGTVTPDGIQNYIQALQAYNAVGGPTLFDPVGAGATQLRKDAVKTIMAAGYFDVIKGNEGEIKTVAGVAGAQQKGVDSGASTLTLAEKGKLVKELALKQHNIVLMTGAIDVISDGTRTYAIGNGHKYLGLITGSGCTLGTTIASFLAVHKEDKLLAAITGIVLFEIAAEYAAGAEYPGEPYKFSDSVIGTVDGPGSFVPVFLDALHKLRTRLDEPNESWLSVAKVEAIEV